MKIHEYQAKELMEKFGIPVPRGSTASTVEEGIRISKQLFDDGCTRVFVKAQVHAGGRGKAGGILPAKNLSEAEDALKKIIGMTLVTKQTGTEGKYVRKVLIVDGSQDIKDELYASIILDREKERPVIMASTEGGVDIESVAANTPELILKEHIHPLAGMDPYQARNLAMGLGLKGNTMRQGAKLFLNLANMFRALDASQIEINPLAITGDDSLLALDAKLNFDESALYRHKEVTLMRDLDEESPLEVEASKHGLNYIKLDGSIGCMVNGAGLAMATMDIIKYYGATPANFLDVGGGASEESITEAFKILLADQDVKAVLVNIFGGIVRCDRVARGIIGAAKNVGMNRPLVVRLSGTNAEEGIKLLTESGLALDTAVDMADAAQKIISRL